LGIKSGVVGFFGAKFSVVSTSVTVGVVDDTSAIIVSSFSQIALFSSLRDFTIGSAKDDGKLAKASEIEVNLSTTADISYVALMATNFL